MAIDYIINQYCGVKEKITTSGIIRGVKQRNQAMGIVARLKQDGKTEEEVLKTEFKIRVQGETGVKEQIVTPKQLLDSVKQLEELKDLCKSCPLARQSYFGCYQAINYPISKRAEEWIAQITKKAIESDYNTLVLVMHILKNNITGQEFKRMHENKDRIFFELPHAIEVKAVNKKRGLEIKVTTDQIFEAIFGKPTIDPQYICNLLMFTSCFNFHKGNKPDKPDIMAVEMGPQEWAVFELRFEKDDDASTRQIKFFFRSLFYAYAFRKEMLINF